MKHTRNICRNNNDLQKLSTQSEITKSNLFLANFKIFKFNKRYNYKCSNNTKGFCDLVV